MELLKYSYIKNILYRFPNTHIKNLNIYNQNSNNNIIFNNNAKYFILKPKGRKAYIWFTYYEKEMLCILILINNKNINDCSNEFYKIPVNFDNTLLYNNVLLFGYYLVKNISNEKNQNQKVKKTFINNKFHYFIIENVFNYNIYKDVIEDKNYNNIFKNKLALYHIILKSIKCLKNLDIRLPIILNNSSDVFKIIYNLDYKLYNIHVYGEYKYLGNYNISENKHNEYNITTFKIFPCINQDLYLLYVLNNNKEEFYDYALIDSYKTSIFMNNIFRTIKENKKLDYLEESDDEEEFENINNDKFVHLGKNELIQCSYNIKFKKWIPIKISKEKLIDIKKYPILGKKKYLHSL
jgi:hypothetical protein